MASMVSNIFLITWAFISLIMVYIGNVCFEFILFKFYWVHLCPSLNLGYFKPGVLQKFSASISLLNFLILSHTFLSLTSFLYCFFLHCTLWKLYINQCLNLQFLFHLHWAHPGSLLLLLHFFHYKIPFGEGSIPDSLCRYSAFKQVEYNSLCFQCGLCIVTSKNKIKFHLVLQLLSLCWEHLSFHLFQKCLPLLHRAKL